MKLIYQGEMPMKVGWNGDEIEVWRIVREHSTKDEPNRSVMRVTYHAGPDSPEDGLLEMTRLDGDATERLVWVATIDDPYLGLLSKAFDSRDKAEAFLGGILAAMHAQSRTPALSDTLVGREPEGME